MILACTTGSDTESDPRKGGEDNVGRDRRGGKNTRVSAGGEPARAPIKVFVTCRE